MFKPEVSQFSAEKFFKEVMKLEPMEYERLVGSGINLGILKDSCIKVANDVDKLMDDHISLWSEACATEKCPAAGAVVVLSQFVPKMVAHQARVKMSFLIEDIFKALRSSHNGVKQLEELMKEYPANGAN